MKKVFEISQVITILLFFLIVPLLPDVQVSRPKLLGIELISFVLISIFLFKTLKENKFVYRSNNFVLAFFIFWVYITLRYTLASEKPLAFSELKRWTIALVMLYSVSVVDTKYYDILFTSFIFGSFLSILYGFLQHTGGIWRIQVPKLDRVMSMFGNPIFFAVHIINFLPIVFARSLLDKKIFSKFVYLFIFIFSLITLYYTKTRAAFIGVFVASLLFMFLTVPSKKRLLYLLVVFFTFLVFIFLTKNIWTRQQAHFLIWRDSLKMWSSKPIFGIGLGRFHVEFVNFASEQLRRIWPERQFIINDAHNEYIQFLAENGIVGFILFTLTLYLLIKGVIKFLESNSYAVLLKKQKKSQTTLEYKTKILVICLLCSMVAVMVQNVFSVDLRFMISNTYLFITAGFIVGYISELKEKKLFFDNKFIRILSIILMLFVLGIISYYKSAVRILSVLHISKDGIKLKIDNTGGLLGEVIKPYIANYKLKQEKDFFDEKILNAAETLKELEELKNKYPNEPKIYEKIAWIYAKEKQFDKAVQTYLKVIELNPTAYAAYNNLGNIMFLTNNMQKAIEFYKKSIEINPNQIDARLNLGIAYYYQGKLNLAAEQFNEVLKLDPENEKAIVYLKKMRE